MSDPAFNLDVERARRPTRAHGGVPALFLVGDSTVKNHDVQQQEGGGELLDHTSVMAL